MSYPGSENEFAKSAGDMKIPSWYDNKDYGKKTRVVAKKVRIKSSGGDGKEYGARAIMTKEDVGTFKTYLLNEKKDDDITALPDSVVGEIKSNIRKGAKDLSQAWKNALELVHRAYQVANVRGPTPTQKGAWKQYEEMIRFAVAQLKATRGIDGNWRMTNIMVREAAFQQDDSDLEMRKKRFFVEVPGEQAVEVDGEDMDEIIDQLSNKLRRNGARVQVAQRDDHRAVLNVVVNGVLREQIVIKEIS